jgi:hypothetical protein
MATQKAEEKEDCKCPYYFACSCELGIPHFFSYNCSERNGYHPCIFGNGASDLADSVVRSKKHKFPFAVNKKRKFAETKKAVYISPVEDPCFIETCARCKTENRLHCDGNLKKNGSSRMKHYTEIPPGNQRVEYLEACRSYPTKKNASPFHFENVFIRCENKMCNQIIVMDYTSVQHGDGSQQGSFCQKHFRDPNAVNLPMKAMVLDRSYTYYFKRKFNFPTKQRHVLLDPCVFYVCPTCPRYIDRYSDRLRDVVVPGNNGDVNGAAPKCNLGHQTAVSHPHQVDSNVPCPRCNSIIQRYKGEPCVMLKYDDGIVRPFYCETVQEVTAAGFAEIRVGKGNEDKSSDVDENDVMYRRILTYECRRCEEYDKTKKKKKSNTTRRYCYACFFWHNMECHWTYREITNDSPVADHVH